MKIKATCGHKAGRVLLALVASTMGLTEAAQASGSGAADERRVEVQ